MPGLNPLGQFGEYEVWEDIYDGKPEWHITDGNGEFIYPGDDDLLKALTLISNRANAERAAATRPIAEIVADMVSPNNCEFDHHGGCQMHGYLDLEPGEVCPQAEAKQWLAEQGEPS